MPAAPTIGVDLPLLPTPTLLLLLLQGAVVLDAANASIISVSFACRCCRFNICSYSSGGDGGGGGGDGGKQNSKWWLHVGEMIQDDIRHVCNQ